jgi:two-component system, chemotaxis family, sensor kinase CheA
MSGFDISKYREMFQEEAIELFENIDTVLLKAEDEGELNDEDMNSLFRFVHTLKGSSASVELANFARFTHEVESFMDKLRNKKLDYIPEMASLLIDCTDAMKTVLEEEMGDTLTPESFNDLTASHIAGIKEMSEGGGELKPAITTVKPVEQSQQQEDSFGFFDDDIVERLASQANAANIVADSDNESFGFFDDEPTKLEPDVAQKSFGFTAMSEDDGFGFFDDEPVKNEIKKETPVGEGEAFGFFEEIFAEAFAGDPVEEHFGFFDATLQAKHAASQGSQALPESSPALTTPTSQAAPKPKVEKEVSSSDAKGSIRVDLSKIDVLMNNVGELVIVNSMLFQLAEEIGDASMRSQVLEKLKLLDRHTRELQDSVMSVRMVPMENIYSKFPKTVRDVSKKLDKKVEFKHTGDNVEIDKAMIEGLTDPLMHIVRNSLDHGLEMPDIRRSRGKPETGTIMIGAEQANGQIIITISDDGNGIPADIVALKALEKGSIDKAQYDHMSDEEKVMLIFAPGLSTASEVTDLSGRGVGMDVVKTNITKLGGTISVTTEIGVGTTMTIALPLTLAILDGLNISVGEKNYILPLASIVESLQPKEDMVKRIGDGEEELLMLRSEFIPVVRLHKLFNIEPKFANLSQGMLIVVRTGKQKLALFVDEFLHQQQVVVKPIDKNFRNVKGVGGATVRGDGSIGLILDVIGILEEQKKLERRRIK